MSRPILQLKSVSKSFSGFKAVSNMDIQLASGEICALIGPNGAGKTTLLSLISGTYRPTSGDILLNGASIAGMEPHRIMQAGLGRSFQITSIFPGMTVFENVQIALLAKRSCCTNLFRTSRRLFMVEVTRLLSLVRIEQFADRVAGTLPAGDQKRLEFALSLAGEPDVMLLDEPTAGMTAAERQMIVQVLRDINKESGMTILFTEHDIDMVFSLAQKVIVMKLGEKLVEGLPDIVRDDPLVKAAYLGSRANA